ncbi:hypothetical protein [Conexibacter sp. SYSU D00693]|uniref:hypothetical protein n=1 Tax=Conexibacter sp. SYSU D00693 TaxID=2812560 RepID=UPI00196B7012|nr:hypothetical protein [Conexibacter sp. SYSU D00693]
MAPDPDALLADSAVNAAVDALATRNAHHLSAMSDQERADALSHWRELALDVLTAARATLESEQVEGATRPEGQPGRAVIVLEDAGDQDVAVHASFHPELEEIGENELQGTPAQIAAMSLLQELMEGGEE